MSKFGLLRQVVVRQVASVLLLFTLFIPVKLYAVNELGILYLVEKQGRRNFILGTIHRTSPFLHGFLAEMQPYLLQANELLVELDSARQVQHLAQIKEAARSGQTIDELIGPELFQHLKSTMGYGKGESFPYAKVKPWLIWSVLVSPEDGGDYMDLRLQRNFRQRFKDVTALETVHDQIAVYDGLSQEDQVALLKDAIKYRDQIRALAAEMLFAYRRRNLHRLHALITELPWDADRELYARLYTSQLDVRNYAMAKKIKRHFRGGPKLAAVGALHLPGEQGLLRILERDGYKISVLY